MNVAANAKPGTYKVEIYDETNADAPAVKKDLL